MDDLKCKAKNGKCGQPAVRKTFLRTGKRKKDGSQGKPYFQPQCMECYSEHCKKDTKRKRKNG